MTAPTLQVLWDLRVEAISEVFMFWRFLGSGQRDRISMDLAKDFHLVKTLRLNEVTVRLKMLVFLPG